MAAVNDSFTKLESYRLQLEENVTKLTAALQHWQTWNAEYEGFKEEILGLDQDPTTSEMVIQREIDIHVSGMLTMKQAQVGTEYGGTLLNDRGIY